MVPGNRIDPSHEVPLHRHGSGRLEVEHSRVVPQRGAQRKPGTLADSTDTHKEAARRIEEPLQQEIVLELEDDRSIIGRR